MCASRRTAFEFPDIRSFLPTSYPCSGTLFLTPLAQRPPSAPPSTRHIPLLSPPRLDVSAPTFPSYFSSGFFPFSIYYRSRADPGFLPDLSIGVVHGHLSHGAMRFSSSVPFPLNFCVGSSSAAFLWHVPSSPSLNLTTFSYHSPFFNPCPQAMSDDVPQPLPPPHRPLPQHLHPTPRRHLFLFHSFSSHPAFPRFMFLIIFYFVLSYSAIPGTLSYSPIPVLRPHPGRSFASVTHVCTAARATGLLLEQLERPFPGLKSPVPSRLSTRARGI